MTLRECYEAIGASYDEILGRFRREELVDKFVMKFIEDKSFGDLCTAMEENNSAEAFRLAHTIKGISQNLSFDRLYKSSCALTEALRNKPIDSESFELFKELKKDYIETSGAIKLYAGIE